MAELDVGRIEIREKPCRKCGHAKTWNVPAGPGVLIPVNPGSQVQYLLPPPVRSDVSTGGVLPRWVV